MLTQERQAHLRQSLSEHDVLALLNFELSAYEECAGCHFAAITPAKVVDKTGCNWRSADLLAEGKATDAARAISREVIEEVRDAYNLDRTSPTASR
jgi:hypothetical protein